MAKKAQSKSDKKQERAYKKAVNTTTKNMEKLSTLFNDTMANMDSRISGPSIFNQKEIEKLDNIVKGVVTNEIDNIESLLVKI